MNTLTPDIPKNTVEKWQGIVDLIAQIVEIPSALIMRVWPAEIEVFVANRSELNPYEPGERTRLDTGLYCETVIQSRDRLFVPDARRDKTWKFNPDMKLGMISYLGFPILWPDDCVFGTICILDRKEIPKNRLHEKLMLQFRDVIESDLRYLFKHEKQRQNVQKLLHESEMSRLALLNILEDQREAEEALKESEEKYRTLFESAPEAITLLDNENCVQKVNKEFTRMFGYSPREVIGQPIDNLITDEDYRDQAMAITRQVAKGESINVETVRRRKDGTQVDVSILGKPIRVGGKQVALYGIYRDITEQKRAEKLQASIYRISEAAQSRENLDELFETIHDIIGKLMPTRNFYIALLDEETKMLSFPYFVDEYDEQHPPKRLGKGLTEYVLRSGKPLLVTEEEIETLAREGEIELIGTVPVDWLGVPLKTKDSTVGLLATQSYTEGVRHTADHKNILKFVSTQVAMAIHRKRAEEKLRILAKFPAENPSPVLRVAKDGTLVYANANSRVLLQEWDCKVGNLIPDPWRHHVADALDSGSINRLEGQIGDRVYTFLVAPLDDADCVYLYVQDITEYREAEEELRNANESLTEANMRTSRMMVELEEARDELRLALDVAQESDILKSEFLANTSHELRTPLNSIIGFLKLILDGLCDSPEEEREFIENALASSHTLLELINDILDIAKIEAGKTDLVLESLSLRDVFDEVYLLTHVQADQKNLRLKFFCRHDKDILVTGDYQKVKQVLLNLIGNSIKFTSKGSIRITGRAMPRKDFAEIRVEDTGIGIEPERQYRIFDKFTQADGSTSRKYGGTGLGLTITKNLVELMGGKIELTSPGIGQGTTVTFTLPLSQKTVPTTLQRFRGAPLRHLEFSGQEQADNIHQGDPAQAIGTSDGKPQIVIVEDDEMVREYLEKLLSGEGYSPFSAGEADKGFELIQQVHPQCVIIDFCLPATMRSNLQDGLSLMRALEENEVTRAIPTILISGHEEQVHKILSIKPSISAKPIVLGKPIDSDKLLSFLDDFCRKNNKRSLNILLADDDANVGRYLGKILSRNGYHLTVVGNGKEALDSITDEKGEVDILLLDLMMPLFNGYDVIRELKVNQKAPDLPIIIITNYPETDNKEQNRLLSKGMIVDLITKEELNTDPTVLLDLLENLTQ